MSINLLELINENITPDIVSKLSGFLGESPNNTTTALSSAIPSLLGGLVNKSAESQGASTILNLLNQGNHEGGILNNLGAAFTSGEGTSNLLSTGASLLNAILGNKTDGVASLVANASGISKTSSNSLLGILMPIVFGALGKTVKAQGITSAAGLADLLGSQSGFLKNFLPAGLSSTLGMANLTDFGKTASAATAQIVEENSGSFGKLLPWLLLPILLAVGWGVFKTLKQPEPTVPEPIVQQPTPAPVPVLPVPEVVAPVVEKVSDFFEKTLSSGFAIKAAKDGFESKLIGFIEDTGKAVDKDTWFTMNGIVFDTGKATLKPESNTQMTNIAEILKAYPNVKIKIGGYTDNKGNAKSNLALSAKRANAVKNALVAVGIDTSRLDAEGFGSEHPVADNGTEAGRQQNRRIDVLVTAK